jgi:CheY-like chemotaxis protein
VGGAISGSASEIAPSALANRRDPAIGGTTVAWQDFGFDFSPLHSEILVHDLATASTTRAPTGLAALDFIVSHPGEVDLVLTDVIMPRMNGRELADHLRDSPPGPADTFHVRL